MQEALSATRGEVIRLHERHLSCRMMKMYEFIGLDNIPVRAAGTRFWDASGQEYLDFLSAFGTLPFGHNPPRLCDVFRQLQERQFPNLVEGPSPLAAALASNLSLLAPGRLERVYFGSAGTEAVDAAIKMARAATGRSGLLACRRAYHGRSIGALSVMDRPEYRQNFEPLLSPVRFVPHGDADALEPALSTKQFGAFILEPVQGEGGMLAAPRGYLRRARELCSATGTVLIFDEIQSGMGRTGKLWASQHEDVSPDCLLLGKALGGGLAPISALLTTDDLWHASKGDAPQSPFQVSTYSANSYSCAVALATLEGFLEEGLVESAAASGTYLLGRLREVQTRQPLLGEVTGLGLMIGMRLSPPGVLGALLGPNGRFQNSDGRFLLSAIFLKHLITEHRVVTAVTVNNPDVIRVQPPLNVERSDLDRFVEAVESTLEYLRRYVRAVFQSAPDIVRFVRSNPVAAVYE